MSTMETAPTDRVISVEFTGIFGGWWHVRRGSGLWINDGRQPDGEAISWREASADDGVPECRRLSISRQDRT